MAIRITRAGVALTVGIILVTGLIIGGLFLVKNQGEQARRNEAINIAEKNLQDQSNEGVALNEGDKKDESNQSEGSAETAKPNESASESTAGSGAVAGDATVNELPTTGPADSAAILVLGLLTFAGISYYRSRRALLNS